MPGPLIDSLINEIDHLPYAQRQRLLAERARLWAGSGQLEDALAQASKGGVFERQIGLFLATVAAHTVTVQACLRDDDWSIRRQALRASLSVPVDADILAALIEDAPAELRQQLYRLVRRTNATAIAQRWLPMVRDVYGDREAARLLSACSRQTVAELLPELSHAVGNWAALSRSHPGPVLAEAARQLEQASARERRQWWTYCGAGILSALHEYPEQILDLLERYPVDAHLHGLGGVLAVAARFDPVRTLRLLGVLEQAHLRHVCLRRKVLASLAGLPLEDLARFGRRHLAPVPGWTKLLKAVAPSRRGRLFALLTADWDAVASPLDERLLAILPRTHQPRLAQQALELPIAAEDEQLRLRYTAYLPYGQAHAALERATRRHLPEDRAAGYELLIECAIRGNDPAIVGEMLGALGRLRNEQDPVRARALMALARVPVRLFEPAHAQQLAMFVADALAARDSSFQTRYALGELAVRVLAERSDQKQLLDWSLSTLDQMFGSGRLPLIGPLDRVLRRGQEHQFFAAVRPWIESGVQRGRYEPLVETARALGRRAWGVPALQELVGRATKTTNVTPVVREAIDLWLADPSHRGQRVEAILLDDPSTVTLASVWHALSLRRTDLLDLILSGPPPQGRHLAPGLQWVPAYAPGLHRWLPRQHRAYGDRLSRVAGDASATAADRTSAIRAGARIPGYGWTLAHKYAGSANPSLDEAALGALVWTDRPADALPILLSHADDDRARVAIYAICRAARFETPSRLHPLLADLLRQTTKVTSRKEAIRLLASFVGKPAMPTLADLWEQEDVHRDTRVALVGASRQHLDHTASWRVLADAVASPQPAVAHAVLCGLPWLLRERHRERYAALVAEACRATDPMIARVAWASYAGWARWAPGAISNISEALCDMDSRTVWRTVAETLVSLLDYGFHGDEIASNVELLLACEMRDGYPDAAVDRDRPARQRLLAIVDLLARWADRQPRRHDFTPIERAGSLLANHPGYLREAFDLMVRGIPFDAAEPQLIFARLEEFARLAAERPLAAQHLASVVHGQIAAHRSDNHAVLLDIAIRLCHREDLPGGLLALELAKAVTSVSSSGWANTSVPWRSVLSELRRHPHPDVVEAALSVFTADEQ